jgi:ribose transport system substrate-binding protein
MIGKKLFWVISLAGILVLAPVFGAGGSASGKVKVGVVTPAAMSGFTGESVKHAEAEIKAQAASRSLEYRFLTANETSEQNNRIDDVLSWGADVVVLWPIEGNALRSAAQKVLDAGKKLIIYDRLIENFRPTAELMGDNETIGLMTGRYFNKFFADDIAAGKKINSLEFWGDNSTVPKQRADGLRRTINQSAYNLLHEPYTTQWQRQTSMEQMETWLNTSSRADVESLQAIITQDDEVALGVLDALRNYKGDAKLNVKLLTGVSGQRESIQTFLNPGVPGLKQVTYTFSPAMVREAVRCGVNAAYNEQYNEKPITGLILIPVEEVDETNLDAYQNSTLYKERYSI